VLGSAVIVLRESLEAALVIGVVAAATRAIPGRSGWLTVGVLGGVLGSILVAASAGQIGQWAEGLGQEIFNAIVLGVAVLMLAWHNIWMAAHARQVVGDARSVAVDVHDGRRTLSAIALVVAIAVLREGSETVLFLYGLYAGGESTASVAAGALVGLVGGLLIGIAMYEGLLHIPLRWFFAVTGGLVLLLAAGMAGQIAHYLIQADVLPALAEPLWDSSALVPNESTLGALLHALLGYDARPAGLQVLFFLVALTAVFAGMRLVRSRTR
jgi:high-affinity iron transporter